MFRVILSSVAVVLAAHIASAADDKIDSALSAGPDSLSRNATVMDWDGKVLRKGSNSWTCLPDRPNNGGKDPFCVDKAWLNLLNAAKDKKKPTYDKLGIAYMLAGDAPVSNISPTGKKEDGDWVDFIFKKDPKDSFLYMTNRDIERERWYINKEFSIIVTHKKGWTDGGDFFCFHKDLIPEYPSVIDCDKVDGQPKQEIIASHRPRHRAGFFISEHYKENVCYRIR